MVGTKDGFNFLDVQQRTAAVNQGLKNLIHLPAGAENKVAAVFDLIVGILVMKPAAFLLFQLKGTIAPAVPRGSFILVPRLPSAGNALDCFLSSCLSQP